MHRKAKKACGSERQKSSMHIGFCNCARAAVHVALNILSVVDETVCLQFDNCVLHCIIPVQGYSTIAPTSRVSRSKKNKRKGWRKKDLNIHNNSN